jgi:hypothetical protein
MRSAEDRWSAGISVVQALAVVQGVGDSNPPSIILESRTGRCYNDYTHLETQLTAVVGFQRHLVPRFSV